MSVTTFDQFLDLGISSSHAIIDYSLPFCLLEHLPAFEFLIIHSQQTHLEALKENRVLTGSQATQHTIRRDEFTHKNQSSILEKDTQLGDDSQEGVIYLCVARIAEEIEDFNACHNTLHQP